MRPVLGGRQPLVGGYSLFPNRDPHHVTAACPCMVCTTWAKLAESAAPSLPSSRAQDQREAAL